MFRSNVERVRPGFSTVCAGVGLWRNERLFDQGVTAMAAPEVTSRFTKSRRSVELFMGGIVRPQGLCLQGEWAATEQPFITSRYRAFRD